MTYHTRRNTMYEVLLLLLLLYSHVRGWIIEQKEDKNTE